MTRTLAPSVFDSFNARSLEPEQVASTFIPPTHYRQLVKPTHTLVVGPRGSGKTTLLKMLQGAALESWRHPDAADYRAQIQFTGVFIPTDVSWASQINALGESILEREYRDRLGVAAFTTHVLRRLIIAMEYRSRPPSDPNLISHRRAPLSRSAEVELVRRIANAWHVTPQIPTLLSLRQELSGRLLEIREFSSQETLLEPEGRAGRFAGIRYLHLHFLSAAGVAAEAFDDIAVTRGEKWALLFDELELAPDWLVETLLRSIRSTDERFLFKLSMSPYTSEVKGLTGPQAPRASNDYEQVSLWYAHKEDGYDFCRALFRAMLQGRGLPIVDPTVVFGHSYFETNADEWQAGTAYMQGSRLQKRFKQLAKKDRTFRDYLQSRNVDVEDMEFLSGDARAADVRKVVSLVAVREAFRTADERLRSRKHPSLYKGASALFAMVEGNPRWFIAIIGALVERRADPNGRVAPPQQSRQIEQATIRFRALLNTIPCPPLEPNEPPRGALAILDRIGEFFFNAIVRSSFNPDPPGSFIIDSRAHESLADSLGTALNAGAIVYVPRPGDDLALESLEGRRFRLSYLLAPHYQLPLVLGRPVNLSTILRLHPKDGAAQEDLPFVDEEQ